MGCNGRLDYCRRSENKGRCSGARVGFLLAAVARSGAWLVGYPPSHALLTRLTCPSLCCRAERRMVGRMPAQPCSAHAVNVSAFVIVARSDAWLVGCPPSHALLTRLTFPGLRFPRGACPPNRTYFWSLSPQSYSTKDIEPVPSSAAFAAASCEIYGAMDFNRAAVESPKSAPNQSRIGET